MALFSRPINFAKRVLRRILVPKKRTPLRWAGRLLFLFFAFPVTAILLTTCGAIVYYLSPPNTLPFGGGNPYKEPSEFVKRQVEEQARNVPVEILAKLPPDPGEDGKKTLQGIDSDGNGLRDDLDRFVAIRFHGRPVIQRAMIEELKLMDRVSITSGDKKKSVAATYDHLSFVRCRSDYLDGIDEEFLNLKHAAYMNTALRYAAQVEAAGQFSGESWEGIRDGVELEAFCKRRGLSPGVREQARKDVRRELEIHEKK